MALQDGSDEPEFLLATLPPTSGQRPLSLVVVAVLLLALGATAPFAARPLPRTEAFIPALESVFFVNDFITAALLFSQFSLNRSRALLILASGYLFAALIVIPHALTFPGAFSPTGLLGAGLQSTAALYYFWHLGFAMAILTYAWLKDETGAKRVPENSIRSTIGWSVAIVISLVCMLTWLCTAGDEFMPRLFADGARHAPLLFYMGALNILIGAAALGLLWVRRYSLLDQWLMVVVFALVSEVVLATMLNGARFSFGFYAGRMFSLVTTVTVLVVLIAETTRLYARLEIRTRELTKSLRELQITQGQLVQAEKLAALGRLVSGVAHEINTPVGNGLTIASALTDKADRFEADAAGGDLKRTALTAFVRAVQDAASQMLNNLRHVADLIHSFKQVASNPNVSDRRDFDIGHVTDQIVRGLRSGMRSHNLTVSVECEPNLLVSSYPGPFGQILTNLVLNSATHAFPDGKRGSVHIALQASGEEAVEIQFSDDGCGMIPEVERQAFDPFFTTRRGQGSTGLGLHIVHNIVTSRLGGRINLDAKPGEGTKVQIILPRKAPLVPELGGSPTASAARD